MKLDREKGRAQKILLVNACELQFKLHQKQK